MIAKLFAFRIASLSLKLIYCYLSSRTQWIKINKYFSYWIDIEFGVPQVSVLGSLLFNIDITDLFCESQDSNVSSYADDTTLYSCATDIPSVAFK